MAAHRTPLIASGTLIACALLCAGPAAAGSIKGGAAAPPSGVTADGGVRYGVKLVTKRKPLSKSPKRTRKPSAKPRRKLTVHRKPSAPKPKRQPRAPAPATDPTGYVFPVRGAFDYGSDGSRFGAGRKGHTHQGQDMAAAEGTPVVTPWAGTVKTVQYQAGGAGHYVVVGGSDARDYVFMHLRSGSIPVEEGQSVTTGQQIGEVGNTGSSSGAHLHFEVWVGGGWYTGGHPIDPLPLLTSWAPPA